MTERNYFNRVKAFATSQLFDYSAPRGKRSSYELELLELMSSEFFKNRRGGEISESSLRVIASRLHSAFHGMARYYGDDLDKYPKTLIELVKDPNFTDMVQKDTVSFSTTHSKASAMTQMLIAVNGFKLFEGLPKEIKTRWVQIEEMLKNEKETLVMSNTGKGDILTGAQLDAIVEWAKKEDTMAESLSTAKSAVMAMLTVAGDTQRGVEYENMPITLFQDVYDAKKAAKKSILYIGSNIAKMVVSEEQRKVKSDRMGVEHVFTDAKNKGLVSVLNRYVERRGRARFGRDDELMLFPINTNQAVSMSANSINGLLNPVGKVIGREKLLLGDFRHTVASRAQADPTMPAAEREDIARRMGHSTQTQQTYRRVVINPDTPRAVADLIRRWGELHADIGTLAHVVPQVEVVWKRLLQITDETKLIMETAKGGGILDAPAPSEANLVSSAAPAPDRTPEVDSKTPRKPSPPIIRRNTRLAFKRKGKANGKAKAKPMPKPVPAPPMPKPVSTRRVVRQDLSGLFEPEWH